MKLDKIENLSKEECESILGRLDYWMWDERLGKKPFMYEQLVNYKKHHNLMFRLGNLFRAVWPFTKADYVHPVRRKIFELYPELNDVRKFFL